MPSSRPRGESGSTPRWRGSGRRCGSRCSRRFSAPPPWRSRAFRGSPRPGCLGAPASGRPGRVTRWVLPALTPSGWTARKAYALPFDAQRAVAAMRRSRWAVATLLAAALAVVAWGHDRLWDDDLANLTPLSPAAKRLDETLRAD